MRRESDLEIKRREASCAAQLADIKARLLLCVASSSFSDAAVAAAASR